MLLGGDFNLPDIDWKNKTHQVTGNYYNKSISEMFLDTINNQGLSQLVNFPTRLDNTLDLFLTNRPSLTTKCAPLPGISEHDMVLITTMVEAARRKPTRRKILLWSKADLYTIRSDMKEFGRTYTTISRSTPIDELWATFREKMADIITKHVPSKTASTRFSQPWITSKIKSMSRKRQRQHNKAKTYGRQEDWENFRATQKKIQEECRNALNSYITDTIC